MLKREHSLVRLVVEAARRNLPPEGDEVVALDLDRVTQLLDFFHYCSDACHDPKEEKLLFDALHRRGLAWNAYPLRELMEGHAELNVILQSVGDWLPPLRTGDRVARLALLHDLHLYLTMLDEHMALEESVLFPLTLRILEPEDLERLRDDFAAVACDELDSGAHAYYADLAQTLAGTMKRR